MQPFLAFVGAIALIPLLTILRGLVLSTLWRWFLVPLGAPAIGIAAAIGISVIVAMLTANPHAATNEKTTALQKTWLSILLPLVSLLSGWIVQFFL